MKRFSWTCVACAAVSVSFAAGAVLRTIGETKAYGDEVVRALEYQQQYKAVPTVHADAYPPADPRFREIMLRMSQGSDHPDLVEIAKALGYGPGEVPEYTQPVPWGHPNPAALALAVGALEGVLANPYWIGTLQGWIAWMEATQWWSPEDIDRMVKAWYAREAAAYATATILALDP